MDISAIMEETGASVVSQTENIADIDDTCNIVLNDYEMMEKLADNYKTDADYYVNVSDTVSHSAEDLSVAILNINTILDAIDSSQKELDTAVQSVNDDLQQITYASDTVLKGTQNVADSVTVLQTTIQQFQV